MTWEQRNQWLSQMRARIAAKVAGVQPRAGYGVVVQGNVISLDALPIVRSDRAAEMWDLCLYAVLTVTSSLSGVTVYPLALAARVSRATGRLIQNSLWELTQIVNTETAEEGVFYTRSVEMEFFARVAEPGTYEDFEAALYYFPVKIVLEEMEDAAGPDTEVRNTYELTVPRAGVSRIFLPGGAPYGTILRLKSINRV